jgi:hypothetical protein
MFFHGLLLSKLLLDRCFEKKAFSSGEKKQRGISMRYLILIFLIVSCGGGGKSSIQNTPDITSEPVVRTDNFEEVNNIRSYGKASSLLETRMIAPGALKGLAAPEKVYQKNDKRYQIAYTEIKKNLSNLNHIDFKEGLRNIKIVGIDIEFSKDKELFIMLNQAKDIAQLEIHADIITISDPLFIPSIGNLCQ